MLDSHETIVLIRSLWTIARTPDLPEQIVMMRLVQRMREAGAITPQVSLEAIEKIEDFYERHIMRKGILDSGHIGRDGDTMSDKFLDSKPGWMRDMYDRIAALSEQERAGYSPFDLMILDQHRVVEHLTAQRDALLAVCKEVRDAGPLAFLNYEQLEAVIALCEPMNQVCTVTCEICGKRFGESVLLADVDAHLKECEALNRGVSCPTCGRVCADAEALDHHLERHLAGGINAPMPDQKPDALKILPCVSDGDANKIKTRVWP